MPYAHWPYVNFGFYYRNKLIWYFLLIGFHHLWTQRKTSTLFAYSGKKVVGFYYNLGKSREFFFWKYATNPELIIP